MAIEIERKFLLKNAHWRQFADAGTKMCQGYFDTNGGATVRVRIFGDSAVLTIKGRLNASGGRSEYEYPIPKSDAEAMLAEFCASRTVEKIRYHVPAGQGRVWEIDEYGGDNAGLFTAEIELSSLDEEFDRPEWLGDEVTSDRRYANGSLSRFPYCRWEQPEA